MDDNRIQDDPAAIERDIRRTQEDMSRTVDKLGDQLTARNIFNALLDKADQNGVDAQYLIDGARRNPIALGLIAAGAIWLVSDKDSKFPSSGSRKQGRGDSDEFDFDGRDVHHRDYVAHMGMLDMRENEDALAYQRRRDLHRANFLMCERKPEEDDHSFRQRLDEMTESFRQKRRAWTDSASQTGAAANQRTQQLAQQASTKAQDLYVSNPLVGGILAAAVGAAVGSALPVSRQEQEKLGSVGRQARDLASEQKEQLTSQLSEKKDELVEKANQTLQPDDQQGGPQQQPERSFATAEAGQPGSPGASFGDDQPAGVETTFILPDRSV
jgi:hypothetical protein